jgi:hypothetical protein
MRVLGLGSCIVFVVALASRSAASADSKGQLFTTKDRLGTGGQLDRASLAHVREIHMVWPSEDSGNDHIFWMINYAAFFQQPLGDRPPGRAQMLGCHLTLTLASADIASVRSS